MLAKSRTLNGLAGIRQHPPRSEGCQGQALGLFAPILFKTRHRKRGLAAAWDALHRRVMWLLACDGIVVWVTEVVKAQTRPERRNEAMRALSSRTALRPLKLPLL